MSESEERGREFDRRTLRAGIWLGAAALVIGVLMGAVAVMLIQQARNTGSIEALKVALAAQQKQFQDCKSKPAGTPGCVEPVTDEPDQVAAKGERGEPGAQGSPGVKGDKGEPASAAQVAAAVARYCAAGRCQGKPTSQQVAAAVTLYCNARGQCKGTPGTPGPPGTKGDTGDRGERGEQGQQGEQGPGPTAEQVMASVVGYCSQETQPCKGNQGEKGEKGDQGIPGPDPYPFTFQFTVPGAVPTEPARTIRCVIPGHDQVACDDVTQTPDVPTRER